MKRHNSAVFRITWRKYENII